MTEDIVALLKARVNTLGVRNGRDYMVTVCAQDVLNAADEIERLRGEVERLTLERDYWARARNEWEKSARLLEEKNKRLTRNWSEAITANANLASIHFEEEASLRCERDAAVARAEAADEDRDEYKQKADDYYRAMIGQRERAEAAERERDWHKSLTQSHDLLADNAALKTRAEAAEAKVAKLREAIEAHGMMPNGFCVCSKDRDGAKSEHQPECRDLRAILQETGE